MIVVTFVLLLTILVILVEASAISPSSPCPEIFRYEEISDKEWKASLTLIADTYLKEVWIQLLTSPKMVDVVVSDAYSVDYHGSSEVWLSNNEEHLVANIPKTIIFSGNLTDSQIPKLIWIKLNGGIICSSENNGSNTYTRDFKNETYSLSQAISKQNVQCGKAFLLNGIVPNDNVKVLPGNWPWQAGVFNTDDGKSTLLCEATLISQKFLLTSAHCLMLENSRTPVSSSQLCVRLKNLNVDLVNEQNIYEAGKIVIHPNFNEKTLANDIALIKLVAKPGAGYSNQPICLPDAQKQPGVSVILGYGFRQDGSLTNLAIAKARAQSVQECKSLEPSYEPLMNDNNYCATYVQDHGVCVGRSGSGVMDTKSNSMSTFVLTGVLSVGRSFQDKFRCDQNSPVLITDVWKYLYWIAENLDSS